MRTAALLLMGLTLLEKSEENYMPRIDVQNNSDISGKQSEKANIMVD